MGWTLVPLLNFTEVAVPGIARCIRVLLHVNTDSVRRDRARLSRRRTRVAAGSRTLVRDVLGIAASVDRGSIALRARAAGATVIGYDRDPEALRAATAAGALDDTAPDLASLANAARSSRSRCRRRDGRGARRHAAIGKPELVFDVARSRCGRRSRARLNRFVARTRWPAANRGFGAADATLFEDRRGRSFRARPAAQARLET